MLLFEGIWILGLWVRKAVEKFKCCLMGQTSRNMENSGAECDLNCGCLDAEILEEDNVSMWPGVQSYILVKNVVASLFEQSA